MPKLRSRVFNLGGGEILFTEKPDIVHAANYWQILTLYTISDVAIKITMMQSSRGN